MGAWLVENCKPGADLYAVGVQEANYRLGSAASSCAEHMLQLIRRTVGDVELVKQARGASDAWAREPPPPLLSKRPPLLLSPLYSALQASMGQIHLFVFCTPKLRPYISAVEVDTEATGIAGVGVNKGGTAISLYVCSTALCFVNAHLAAHQEKTPQRNAHVLEIQRFLKVGRSTPAEARLDLSNRFGHLFFFGDLNYRIELKREEVLWRR